MAVQVLIPQNCLSNSLTSRKASLPPLLKYEPKPNSSPRSKPDNHKPNSLNSNQAIRAQPNCQKQRKRGRLHNSSSPPASSAVQKPTVANNQLIYGQVKILKRCGEKLIEPAAQHQPTPTPKENRLSPKNVQGHWFYAGSCTSITSPPPSSLPMPSFLSKNTVVSNTEDVQEITIA
ncbi:uncharacterized protein LOC126803732 [Argentina anserina]|uniref:uncharacterized protein LOC126803732 n=1 Tax=Argentina anserina TaxID=57926 RepID=UPI002176285B|nr:uncharacterized protein LOC126803732 [Potentilla anserina]